MRTTPRAARRRCSSIQHPDAGRAAEVGDRDPGRQVGHERLAREHVHEAPAMHLVGMEGDGAGLDELHRGPPFELAVTESVEVEWAVGTHADRLDDGRYEP